MLLLGLELLKWCLLLLLLLLLLLCLSVVASTVVLMLRHDILDLDQNHIITYTTQPSWIIMCEYRFVCICMFVCVFVWIRWSDLMFVFRKNRMLDFAKFFGVFLIFMYF